VLEQVAALSAGLRPRISPGGSICASGRSPSIRTARDHDDAVCVEPLPASAWAQVAIADVARTWRPAPARSRGAAPRQQVSTSRIARSMLPSLSGDLCSLRPGVDRLVLVAELTVAPSGTRACCAWRRR
jgi:exoribonuclease R